MKTPPMLLFATLLFWGWQSHLLWEGVAVGMLLELSRFVNLRWDLDDVDFNRIWSFCMLAVLVLFGYVFTTNDQGGGLNAMTHGSAALRNATNSASVSAYSVFRWLPLIFFPFTAAQAYNSRPTVPLTAVSMVLRIRRRRGEKSLAGRYVDFSNAYFIVCLYSAGLHENRGTYFQTYTYFAGVMVLVLWALWMRRSRRFGALAWGVALAGVLMLAGLGLAGVYGLTGLVQKLDARIMAYLIRSRTDPFQSVTSIGQIGELELSPRIVIRLEPQRVGQAPDYLREASYRTYHPGNQTWLAGGGAKADFANVFPDPDNINWVLISNKVGTATVSIACYLNGRSGEGYAQDALPMPSGSCRLFNVPESVVQIQTNKTGVVLAEGPGLMIFDARYGPGATFDSPPDTSTNQMDQGVPANEEPALKRVIAEMGITNQSGAEIRRTIQAFFLRKFTYSLYQGPDKRSKTNSPLTSFLLNSRSGHCEYFATATVLLLRKLGIPARYAVGYFVHETSGSGYVVRDRDAHAWCLAWNRETKTWEDFDTTPPSWVATEGRRASFFEIFSDLRSWIGFQIQKLRWQQASLRQYILWTLSPVMVVLVYYIIFQRRAKARSSAKKAQEAAVIWPGHDSVFYRLERALAERGLPRQPQEALSEWLERALREPLLADLRAPLRELLRLHYRYRFDPRGLDSGEKKSFVENAEMALRQLAELKQPVGQADK